jgi:ribosomal protein S18 acetylase RimI-like enzyme
MKATNSLLDNKMNETVDSTPGPSTSPPSTVITRVYVREFLPKSDRDPIFLTLRNLFVRSFDEYYKQIENELNLNSDQSLLQWLDETFDSEQENILSGKYRCVILCDYENQDSKEIIVGFLTLKEEEGSIYIAQVAIRLDIKRRGHGGQLLQHLRNIYPSNTRYVGLCRRSNKPALHFYLKQGANFMEDDEVASKYEYNPTLYAGFEFVDTVP